MEHTLALIEKSHQGDKQAREQLVEENMGLVFTIVKRFLGRGYEMEYLVQIGSIGLIKAIDKFDGTYEVKFSTYAVPMISGEIKRFLRDDGMIKVSRSLKETAARVYYARERMEKALGREPDLLELSRDLELDKEEIVLAMEACAEVESLYKPIHQGDGNAILLMDKLEERESTNEQILNRMMVEELMNKLEGREKELIRLRYFEEKTQSEVAERLGMSQVQVSRLEKRILTALRSHCVV